MGGTGMSFSHITAVRRRLVPAYLIALIPALVLATAALSQEKAAPRPPTPLLDADSTEWQDLFDGRTLEGWKQIDYFQPGKVEVKDGTLVIGQGMPFTGIAWTSNVFRINFEIELEAKRSAGHDFFCGLTVPFKDSHCSLIVGGWGGGMFGISSIDGFDASENQTGSFLELKDNKWYRIRLRVSSRKLEAWLDGEKLIDQDVHGCVVSLRPGDIERCVPLGLATWETEGTVCNIRIRKLSDEEIEELSGDE